MTQTAEPAVLQVRSLSVHYGAGRGRHRSAPTVDDVTFDVAAGETVGLVGESGAGKSTIVRAILGLSEASAGSITVDGHDVTHLSAKRRRGVVTELSAVFQDPFSSLSPYQTIGTTVVEPLRRQGVAGRPAQARAAQAMVSVGLSGSDLGRYPHEFSGGQRQRIAIARALVADPRVVVMDEAVSALDLSTQAQVLNLLAELRRQRDYALLFVTHDLGVVRFLCQRVVVLYRGAVMEVGRTVDVTSAPQHPYTKALVAAAPVPRPAEQARRRAARRALLVERAGVRVTPDRGCPFATRCPSATEECRTRRPALRAVNGRRVACHYAT